jgi:hypothetical protein
MPTCRSVSALQFECAVKFSQAGHNRHTVQSCPYPTLETEDGGIVLSSTDRRRLLVDDSARGRWGYGRTQNRIRRRGNHPSSVMANCQESHDTNRAVCFGANGVAPLGPLCSCGVQFSSHSCTGFSNHISSSAVFSTGTLSFPGGTFMNRISV